MPSLVGSEMCIRDRHSNSQITNYLEIIELLQERELIDGIGVQGHYFEFRSDIGSGNYYVYNVNTLKANLNRLADTGLPVYITEFDIDEENDSNQLEQYQIYFPIFWAHPGVKGITLWGYIEGDVWSSHPNTYLLLWDSTERPALQWLRTYIVSPLPPVPISPNFVNNQPRNPVLLWHSSESAESYHVQVAASITFTTPLVDTTVTDTIFQLNCTLEANKRIYWHVRAINEQGESAYSEAASFQTGDQIMVFEESGNLPAEYRLFQNFPNPFNLETKICFQIKIQSQVVIKIYDINGQYVQTIVNEEKPRGQYMLSLIHI